MDLGLRVDGRRPIAWKSGGTVFADVLVQGEREAASSARKLRASGADVGVVRAVDVLAPARSKVYEKGARAVPLRGSAWDFGGRAQ
ncbi:MAG TPA: hypothetical protein VMF35_01220 [Acidimicrobiales bacterium]|nr:hypothetical protein [Acidimicrobiales bacterium]